MASITLDMRLPVSTVIFDMAEFQNLEAERERLGLKPKDHEAMRRLSEQSEAFHPLACDAAHASRNWQ